MAVSAASGCLLSGHADGVLRSWDVNSGQRIGSMHRAGSSAASVTTSVSVHRAGGPALYLAMHKDSSLTLFDARSSKVLRVRVTHFALNSPDILYTVFCQPQTIKGGGFRVPRDCSKV